MLFLSLFLLLSGCQISSSGDWEGIKKDIRSRFPTVKQLSTDELQKWLEDPNKTKPIIIDRREKEEYEVSHLQGAIFANGREEAIKIIEKEGRDRPVVVYCSVGYRSSVLARQLAKDGHTNVYNLEGSIFKWANERRPIYREGRKVRVVHPYSSKWRKFLDRKLWYTPGKKE